MLGMWLAEGASVIHFAPWAPVPAPLCTTLGWHDLSDRHWDDQRGLMVYSSRGRLVLSASLDEAPQELRLCTRCLDRWDALANAVDGEIFRRTRA